MEGGPLRFLVFLLFPGACLAQTSAQAALTSALRATPAAGVVVDEATGRQLAIIKSADTQAAPASILKPLFLNSALQNKEILPQTTVFCRRILTINEGPHHWELNCTHPQTGTPFHAQEALAYSCNRYFVDLADRLPQPQIEATLEHYGLPGATPATKEQKELLVLGLEGITVSPAQIALAYRKLAQEWLPPVRDGLRDSVIYGMAHNAAVAGMEIYGKTGTTRDGWFAGIANLGHQQVVLVIYLPHGNGADAARLAQTFFRAMAVK